MTTQQEKLKMLNASSAFFIAFLVLAAQLTVALVLRNFLLSEVSRIFLTKEEATMQYISRVELPDILMDAHHTLNDQQKIATIEEIQDLLIKRTRGVIAQNNQEQTKYDISEKLSENLINYKVLEELPEEDSEQIKSSDNEKMLNKIDSEESKRKTTFNQNIQKTSMIVNKPDASTNKTSNNQQSINLPSNSSLSEKSSETLSNLKQLEDLLETEAQNKEKVIELLSRFVKILKEPEDGQRRSKRGTRPLDDDNMVSSQSTKEGANVEFFNPKLRHELEAKDEVERARTGHKGTAPGGDSWVWLTSYSRIPMLAIQGFCSATKDYCPPGKQGPAGPTGVPGPKGDRGDTGLPGIPGPSGSRGPRGPPGETGWPGAPGLDGRDGVPGEPGLDGVPGRSGLDGLPGMPGQAGAPGTSGKDGINGTNGIPGLPGLQGPPGLPGVRGLTGPRGRPGKPGTHGTPGTPGINAWRYKSNATHDLLIPPSIAGSKTTLGRPIVVQEGDNVRMRCAAVGQPRPDVEWRRVDGGAIVMGSWQTVSIHGHVLNLTRVNRRHMGAYQCVADNGVPPAANHTFTLEVHFPPLIRIRKQKVGATNGSTAVLECEVEAFPEGVRYWERADGRLLEYHEPKYRVDRGTRRDSYRATMTLRIMHIGPHDYAAYHCVAKNERGITKGEFTLYEIDPKLSTPPSGRDGVGAVAVYGQQPPEHKTLDDLCPPQITCPECTDPKEVKCSESGFSLFDLVRRLEIRPFGNGSHYPGLPNRTSDCVLYAVGKPVYNRFTDQAYGCWMRDPLPANDMIGEKFWVTREDDPYHLFEYVNKSVFRKDPPTKTYALEHPFRGNSHVIYNGSFYYNARDRALAMKFDLATERHHSLEVPLLAINGSNFLYTTDYNYMDFNVDDNGLWIIYGLPDNNNTVVMKVDTELMTTQYSWNISVNHHKVGEMFIVCGVLYAVDSVTERNSRIRLALDLYRNTLLDVNLAFTNPFRKTTMIGYNHKHKELYTWDKGNQLTYPIRYHEIGYNSTKDDKLDLSEPAIAPLVSDVEVYHENNN